MAAEWEADTPKGKKLPEHVGDKVSGARAALERAIASKK
jgi:hypothetical protein